jgi:hypothetical protein
MHVAECGLKFHLRLDIFTAVKIHVVALWIMTPYSVVCDYQHVRGIYCFCFKGSMFL